MQRRPPETAKRYRVSDAQHTEPNDHPPSLHMLCVGAAIDGSNTLDDAPIGSARAKRATPLQSQAMSRLHHLTRFYDLLGELHGLLGGYHQLRECDGSMPWPNRGVYFFFEEGEDRTESGTGPRAVRIGTHALTATSRTRLWDRLKQHKGTQSGAGDHRGSIFRLLVGQALLTRDGGHCRTWAVGSTRSDAARKKHTTPTNVQEAEAPIEREVGAYIGHMPFLWLPIEDAPGPDSQRGVVERNAVALLGNHVHGVLDPASPTWLGHSSDRRKVRTSGLWNQNHVDETYDPGFLDLLTELVRDLERTSA